MTGDDRELRRFRRANLTFLSIGVLLILLALGGGGLVDFGGRADHRIVAGLGFLLAVVSLGRWLGAERRARRRDGQHESTERGP